MTYCPFLPDATSDRDYYGASDEPERCMGCGAVEGQACEEWCETRRACNTDKGDDHGFLP